MICRLQTRLRSDVAVAVASAGSLGRELLYAKRKKGRIPKNKNKNGKQLCFCMAGAGWGVGGMLNRSSLVAQRVKGQGVTVAARLLLWHGFDPWPGNFHIP